MGCGGDPGEGGAALDQGRGWGGVVTLASYLQVERGIPVFPV